MKDDKIHLANMVEKKSSHGNLYYTGKSEDGGRFLLQKVQDTKNKRGSKIWSLFFVNGR